MSRPLELAVFSASGVVAVPLRPGAQVVVGRGEGVDIVLDDPAVSRRHAVFHGGPPVEIEDLGSSNGTQLARAPGSRARGDEATGQQARQTVTRARLEVGDSVFFGRALVLLREAAAQPAARAPALGDFDAVVKDPAMVRLYEEASRAAPLTLPVLVLGETGVGKDVLARFLHERSPRAKRPFVALNCAALSESLADAELFGHEKGAFTGAAQQRAGLFEAADGGTLFLDEIGELPLATQAKLLRTLENAEVLRLGAVKPIKVDVRVVAATNKDLDRASTMGTFRRDLYFRIHGIALHVPPLRARKDEIPELARRFLAASAKKIGMAAPPEISDDALEALRAYAWPGNVRELRFVMERTLVSAGQGPILPEHLPPQLRASPSPAPGEELATRERVIEALAKCNGNQTQAAEMLGVSRRTLINRMIEFGLPRPRKG